MRKYQQKIMHTPTVGAIAVGIDKLGMIYKAVTLDLSQPRTWQARYPTAKKAGRPKPPR